MILLDASTIIDALRAKDITFLAQMKSADGAVCGITRAEILGGAQSARPPQSVNYPRWLQTSCYSRSDVE